MEKQSPVQRIWELGEAEHGRLITAVVLAVVGVVCGMVHYFAAARIIVLLLAGERALGRLYALAAGAAVSGGVSYCVCVYDDGHGGYAKDYEGAVKGDKRDEQHCNRIHKRYRGHQSV